MSTFIQRQLLLDGLCLLVEPRAECMRHIQDIAKLQGAKGERLRVSGYCVAVFDLRFHVQQFRGAVSYFFFSVSYQITFSCLMCDSQQRHQNCHRCLRMYLLTSFPRHPAVQF